MALGILWVRADFVLGKVGHAVAIRVAGAGAREVAEVSHFPIVVYAVAVGGHKRQRDPDIHTLGAAAGYGKRRNSIRPLLPTAKGLMSASGDALGNIWIAALALEHQLPLAARDPHFDLVIGLAVLKWLHLFLFWS